MAKSPQGKEHKDRIFFQCCWYVCFLTWEEYQHVDCHLDFKDARYSSADMTGSFPDM